MADPSRPEQVPQDDEPGRPIWGGYLESDDEAGTVIPLPTRYEQGPQRKTLTYPHKGWNGDVDTYQLDDPLYSREAWYVATKAADKRVRKINLTVPEPLAEAVDQLIAGRFWNEVKTPGDFFRSAGVHELYYRIGEIRDPGFLTAITAHTEVAMLNAIRAEHEAKREFVAGCKEELAAAEGSPSMLREIMEQVWAAMDSGRYDGALLRQLEDLANKYGMKRGK